VKFDWLIIGAGYSACVLAERIATQLAQRVLIVERRDHIGGNAYDYYNEHGILVHKYGPHIFHTKSKKSLGLSLTIYRVETLLSPRAWSVRREKKSLSLLI